MFYFDIVAPGGEVLRDDVGLDLAGLEEARNEAYEDGVRIACDRGRGHERTIMRIRDGQGEVCSVSVQILVIVSTGSSSAAAVDDA